MSAENVPSMLVFGPQTDLPPHSVLEQLRQQLIRNPRLSALKAAVNDLPRFWKSLIKSDAKLKAIVRSQHLDNLKQWINDGGTPPHHSQSTLPNHYAIPVTVLLQIVQYITYLDQIGKDSHQKVLEKVKAGGIQGFCVGFLSAIAVGGSSNEDELIASASTTLRLAVAIGAYVDRDGLLSPEPTHYRAIALRWRDTNPEDKAKASDLINPISGAYISSINDDSSVTVTLKAADVDALLVQATQKGLRTKDVPVHGRFHTPLHAQAVEKLLRFAEGLEFPNADRLRGLVRDTASGSIISEGSLTQLALENTLLSPADWYSTVKFSVDQLTNSKKTIGVIGMSSCIPASLLQTPGLKVHSLDKLAPSIPSPADAHLNSMNLDDYPAHSIAIVGMAGRFPDADSVDELWDLIMEGTTTVKPAPIERLKLPQTGEHANTKWWGNFLRDPEAFDHKFFKKPSREAIAWDPQQRILLEVIYEALESSGYFGARSTKEPLDYGCYIGAVLSNYYDNLSCHPGTAYATVGTSRSFVSGCMSHYFGWTGPSLTIDTACSSSLVALNTACRAIWSGECSRAIAGGTNVFCSPFDYQNLAAASFLSPSGQCKPFDADADGYCRGEGVAVVVLKPLRDAIMENDEILGVVLGSAANQNHNFSHITQPHSGSQVELYRKVMKLGGVEPNAVSYVEAHGTGTGVGDPIEVQSIRDAFGSPDRDSILHFSSIKGNIGHLESTAGVAGLIKVLLMMRHKKIAAQASHNSINPNIPAFDQHQMAIPRSNIAWEAPYFLACINSYGAAGSNSAVMLREKPVSTVKTSHVQLPKYPVVFTAGTSGSISRYSKKMLSWLKDNKKDEASSLLASLAFNLSDRANHALPHVLSKAVSSIADLEATLEEAASGNGIDSTPKERKPVIIVFGGQESDFIGLSEDIYQSSTVFRKNLDSVNDLLISAGLDSFYPAMFSTTPIQDLVTLHSALFAVQYASAQTWLDCGLEISAVVGHSFGQLTALCVSGALSLPDALKLVSGRASLMQTHWGSEAGSMLFLQANRSTVDDALTNLTNKGLYAEIACLNGPESHVVVGSAEAIDTLQQQIQGSIRTKKLNVTNGFHSAFTEPMLPHLTSLAESLDWKRPEIHLETTDELENNAEPDASSVSRHTRQPVFFQRAIERLAAKFSSCTWLEAGRGSSVMSLVKLSVPESKAHTFHSPQLTSTSAQSSLTDITVDLWKDGYATQLWQFHRSQRSAYKHFSLPPIQFEKTRHWLGFTGREATDSIEVKASSEDSPEVHELITFLKAKDSEAIFKIDPQAERFQSLLGGHVMSGQTMAPASLYFEVVARAALYLENDSKVETYTPTVDDLLMMSPIGHNINKKILLLLKRISDTQPQWSFSITTSDEGGEPFEHSTGKVKLEKREDTQSAREFERFETLVGQRRCDEIINHPDAEIMQGGHIYRAFNTVVHYGKAFHGIKQVACLGFEAAGRVRITPATEDAADQRLVDTPMTDSFMQYAGLLVNYFNNQSMEDVLVCMKIEHIKISGSFDPDAGEWLVYSNMRDGGETDASADVYVFEAKTKKMVMAAFGFRFSKMSLNLLARMLKSVNKTSATISSNDEVLDVRDERSAVVKPKSSAAPKKKAPAGKRQELLKVLSNVTDAPLEEIKDETTLDELGIDSLMATEALNDIRSVLGLTIDLSSFLFFPNVKALATYVDEKLGVTSEGEDPDDAADSDSSNDTPGSDGTDSWVEDMNAPGTPPTPITAMEPVKPVISKPGTVHSAYSAFQQTRLNYDRHAEETQAVDFWTDAYPHQARLVSAYIVETFAEFGCDVRKLASGSKVPQIKTLDRHRRLVRLFYRILEDANLIVESPPGSSEFTRTNTPAEKSSAESIYQEVVDLYAQHTSSIKLVRAVGSEMAACLRGDKDGLQVVFGNRETKKTLEEMYEFWPLLRTPTLVLGDFLCKALGHKANGSGKFRILEVGAGTGGTTRYLVSQLQKLGIDFEYVYTDISGSLVNVAAKRFKGTENLVFDVLDIETPPKQEYEGAFHCVVATNCFHATRNLDTTLKHARRMLRSDGVLSLVEITQNMYWVDVVFGLFEGWWLFEDGRQHALVDEKQWERKMKASGFDEVSWSDGDSPESKTIRVIAAFPTVAREKTTVKAAMETVVYKTVDDLDILADVYYPIIEQGAEPSSNKLPIALMIHGGSHMIFSRKDVRPAQTRLLLSKGFLPVSLDYRLCPEVSLSKGPMEDVCDALDWARNKLPNLPQFKHTKGLNIDGEKVVVVGWSSGGQLAMSLAWTAPQRGLKPPSAILAFYSPSDYEDEWWRNPIHPIAAPYKGQQYNVLDGVKDKPIANYDMVGAWEEPIADPNAMADSRVRLILHINWKAQTLPVILNGLPSSSRAAKEHPNVSDWNALPQPAPGTIRAASPRAHVREGTYSVPTFFIHGTADDLIPWQQTQGTYKTMVENGIESGLVLLDGEPHICDLSSDPASDCWKAVLEGFEFICSHV